MLSDGLRTAPIVFVATTNFLEQLDAAAIRESRFDFKIEIPPPDLAARISLLTHSIGTCLGPDAMAVAKASEYAFLR